MNEKLNIALIQSILHWEDPERNRVHFAEKINEVSSDIDIIVLPEMFTTGFTMTPQHINSEEGERTLRWMQEKAAEKGAALVGSLAFNDNGNYSNRLFFVEPEGKFSRYDKHHTFTLAGENNIYSAGTERLLVEYKGFVICPMICYDLRFPVWARNTVDYDVILFVANWPKPRIKAWDTLLKARAIENMAYCVGVNRIGSDDSGHVYTGHSAVYDSLGEQIVFSKNEEILYATLSLQHIISTRKKLKFLEDRDRFNLIL